MTEPAELPEYAVRNRAYWDAYAPEWVGAGVRNWAAAEPRPRMGPRGAPTRDQELGSPLAERTGVEGPQADLTILATEGWRPDRLPEARNQKRATHVARL